jgi:hypothetical protein
VTSWDYHARAGETYNLWGFGCVKMTLSQRVVRVGTDDVEGLTAFFQNTIPKEVAL